MNWYRTGGLAVLVISLLTVPVQSQAAYTKGCFHPLVHRGIHTGAVDENTKLAIRRSKEAGGAEVDVHVTGDDRLVLMHSAKVNLTTNGKGRVRDLTLAQIQTLRTDHGYRVPTLSQAAHTAAAVNIVLVVELKIRSQWTPELYAAAGRIAQRATRHGATVYLGGRGRGFEADIPQYAPTARIYWRPARGVSATPAHAAAHSASMVMSFVARFTHRRVRALERAGYVTALRLTRRFVKASELRVDYVMTNNPDAALRFCRSR